MGPGGLPGYVAGRAQPFVGRVSEMNRLLGYLGQAADEKPTTVLVRGEAGVGKSRLLREFAARAETSGAQVLWGTCIALGTGEFPYAPLIDALRRLVRVVGIDRIRERAGSEYRHLASLMVGFAEDDRDATGGESPATRSRLFAAVLHLLDRLGVDQPVVLVIEDVQWADMSTLDLLAYLSRARTNERVLVIGSQRTMQLPPRHPLRVLVGELEHARAIEQFELTRFGGDDLREYLGGAMDHVTHDVVARAMELTDGNVLFLEEVVAAGILTAPAGDDGPVPVPGTVEDLLLPRFELLGDDARQVMGVAATVGRQVSHRLLAAVCALPEDRMLEGLRECVASEMLTVDQPSDTYLFRHALLRELVHQRLIPGDRLHLHRAIAVALAADDELSYAQRLTVAAEISYHWFQARAFPQALTAAVRAGEHAMGLLAFREASSQFDRALRVWSDVPDAAAIAGQPRHSLLGVAADAARWGGRLPRAVELVRAALSEVDRDQDPALVGGLYERLGSYLWEAGEYGPAETAYDQAITLLAGAPASAVAARVLAVSATARISRGRLLEGLDLGRAALTMARQVKARPEEGRALNSVGMALTLLHEIDEGIAALEEALRIADEGRQLEDLYRGYGNLVFALETAGRLERAVTVAFTGLDRVRQAGLEHTRGRGVLANNACEAMVQLGQWSDAISILERLMRDYPEPERLFPRLTLAEIKVNQGQFDDAERLLSEVSDAGGSVVQPQFLGCIHACVAEIAIWRLSPEPARRALAEGLAAVADVDSPLIPLRLYALALRNEADDALRAAAARRTRRSAQAADGSTMDALLVRLEHLSAKLDLAEATEGAALVALSRAEHARAMGQDSPDDWSRLADRWRALRRPYRTAYALWRAAESAALQARKARKAPDRSVSARPWQASARAAGREAYAISLDLGAVPLRSAVEQLARSARFTLADEAKASRPPAATRSTDPVHLTPRERTVLPLVVAGWTNRKIATKLFITEDTAGVHVANILRKLGVVSRKDAAAAGRALGL